MVDLLKDDDEPLEYECPECGASFKEGTPECSGCGLRFEWSEEPVYECPECGVEVEPHNTDCPACGSEFTIDENGDVLIEHVEAPGPVSVDELLDLAIDEVRVKVERNWEEMGTPSEEPDDPEGPDTGDAGSPGAVNELEVTESVLSEDADAADARPSKTVDVMAYPKLCPGGFTLMGIVFVSTAIAALVFSIVMARYDTWIQGAAEESMGADQRMGFIVGLLGFTAFTILAVYDLLRMPRARSGKA